MPFKVSPSPGRYVPDGPRMKVLAGWLGWVRIGHKRRNMEGAQ